MPNNKYIKAKEKAFTKSMYRLFTKHRNIIKDLLISLDNKKNFNDDLRVALEQIALETAELISSKAKPVLEKGVEQTSVEFNPEYSINWNLRNEDAVRYLDDIVRYNSDIYLKGSIGNTTYNRVNALIRQGVTEGMSYTDIANNIQELDPLVFSKNRAEVIAINELGYAYEKGKNMPMQDLNNQGYEVKKQWVTVGDDRVRPTHLQNEEDGYIPLNMNFSGTGSDIAPADFRCRCATIYKIL